MRRRLVDRQREALRRVGADAVARRDREVIGAARARRRRAAQHTVLAVNVTPLGSAPDLAQRRRREARRRHREAARRAHRERRAVALVIAGAWLTVSVKLCVASGLTPLLAVNVRV